MVWGVDGSWFDGRFGYNYPEGHELGLGSLPQREVFGKLTERRIGCQLRTAW